MTLQETKMKLAILFALGLFGAVNACNAHAWSYIVVDSKGHETTLKETDLDLTYPPDNVRTVVLVKTDGMTLRGTVLTPQQERQRVNAGMLIISDQPISQTGAGWVSSIGGR
jgi:YbbR domain-containing protein